MRAKALSMPGQPIVAVKRILPHLVEDEQFVTMFLDESRVLSRLHHDNVVRTHDVGVVEGVPYLALEYVHGKDARILFNECRRQESPLPAPLACFVIASLLDGLHCAHEHVDEQGVPLGLVHRDVSLQNILLSYDGEVKITDFGIARSAENKAKTEVGVVKGKFGYMSPEQIRSRPLDRRSDIFAAGICLYELLTGERLFSGENNFEAIDRVRNVKIDPPSSINRQIPSALEAIVMKALAKEPEDRYQNATEMSQALRSFMSSNNQRATAVELGTFLRQLFLGEASQSDDDAMPLSAARAATYEETGLAAFADLAPLSQLTEIVAADQVIGSEPMRHSTSMPPPPPGPDEVDEVSALTNVHIPEHRVPSAAPPALNADVESQAASDSMRPPARISAPPPGAANAESSSQSQRNERISDRPGGRVSAPPPASPSDRPPPRISAPPPALASTSIADELDEDDGDVTQVAARPSFGPDAMEAGSEAADENLALPGYSQPPPSSSIPPRPSPSSPPPGTERAGNGRASSWPTMANAQRAVPWSQRSLQDIPAPVALGGLGLILAVLLLILFERRASHQDLVPGTIQFETNPEQVNVLVDGVQAASGTSPILLTGLRPSVPHEVRVQKPGFSDWSVRITVEPGSDLKFPLVRLLPLEDEESDTAAAPAASTASASTPTATAQRAAPEAQKDQSSPKPARSKAAPRKARRSSASATSTGTLRVNSRPWAQIFVDGKPMGNTPQMNLSLPAGKHKLRLVNPQLNLKKDMRISINPGKTTTKIVFFD